MKIEFDIDTPSHHHHPQEAEMVYIVTDGKRTSAKAMFKTWDDAHFYRGQKGGIIFKIGQHRHEIA